MVGLAGARATMDCWPPGTSATFAECCASATPPPTCFAGRGASVAARCCEESPLWGDLEVLRHLQQETCRARPRTSPLARPGSMEHRALATLLQRSQPPAGDRIFRWTSTSLRLKQDLLQRLTARGAHRRTALEIGVGNSATTLLLAALFCKVLAADLVAPLLAGALTQGFSNVFHIQLDSTYESWRVIAETELVSFVLVDADHHYANAVRDIARAVALLARAPQPLLALHDFNLLAVRQAVRAFADVGVLYGCEAIGENFTVEEACRCSNDEEAWDVPGTWRSGEDCGSLRGRTHPVYHEGLLCRVDPRVARRISADLRPLPTSPQQPPSTVWHLYDAFTPDFPFGTLRLLQGAHLDAGGAALLLEGRFPATATERLPTKRRMWLGAWTLGPSRRLREIPSELRFFLHVGAPEAPSGRLNGTIVFNAGRTAFRAKVHGTGASGDADASDAADGQWVLVPRSDVVGLPPIGSPLEVYRGPLPLQEFFGVAASVMHREMQDAQRTAEAPRK
eukprot:TRINITY_DN13967_c1_g1_i1.p1 TRINITY_DN13967_c1_g1~~TRINITY_DN13967_c1_g1_i1.p1  ORF type:complete len:510 (-),score=103.53 TRINITY_DN13967_c1_g1_i1:152-1681(-)